MTRNAGRVRRFTVLGVTLLLLSATVSRSAAQTRPDPRLIFSVFGGVLRVGELWSIPEQPLAQLFGPPLYDTLRLNRTLTTAITAGLNGTLYRSGGWGISAEAVYLGLRIDDDCEVVAENPDVQQRNVETCNDINQRTRTSSMVMLSVGGAYRFASRALVIPYVRLQAGIAVRSGSVVETAGRYTSQTIDQFGNPTTSVQERLVIDDESTVAVRPGLGAGAGLMLAFDPGYQLRIELRNHVLFLERPTGPADALGRVETDLVLKDAPALVIGFDIVLERRRGRRY